MMRQAKNAQRSAIPNGAKPPIGLDTTALPWRLANGMREIAAYCRSACEQQGSPSSAFTQADAIRLYAECHALPLRRVYVDPGVSGVTLRRPALRKLLSDCRAGKIGVVIVQDAERLARDEGQLFVILDEFRRFGVQLLFSTEQGRSAFEFRRLVWEAMCQLGERREGQNR